MIAKNIKLIYFSNTELPLSTFILFFFQVGVEKTIADTTYQKLLFNLPDQTSNATPIEVYGSIEDTMSEIEIYTQEWLSFQSLWDLEMAHVIPRLKTLGNWMTLLNEIK